MVPDLLGILPPVLRLKSGTVAHGQYFTGFRIHNNNNSQFRIVSLNNLVQFPFYKILNGLVDCQYEIITRDRRYEFVQGFGDVPSHCVFFNYDPAGAAP